MMLSPIFKTSDGLQLLSAKRGRKIQSIMIHFNVCLATRHSLVFLIQCRRSKCFIMELSRTCPLCKPLRGSCLKPITLQINFKNQMVMLKAMKRAAMWQVRLLTRLIHTSKHDSTAVLKSERDLDLLKLRIEKVERTLTEQQRLLKGIPSIDTDVSDSARRPLMFLKEKVAALSMKPINNYLGKKVSTSAQKSGTRLQQGVLRCSLTVRSWSLTQSVRLSGATKAFTRSSGRGSMRWKIWPQVVLTCRSHSIQLRNFVLSLAIYL